MTGPKTDKLPNMIAWIFVIGINIFFFSVAFPFLLDELTALLPVLSSYLFASTVILFLLTSFTDPGIIPRKCVWELNGEVPQPYCGVSFRKESSEISQSNVSQKKFLENSMKFCNICQIYKPARTAHCKHCGNCVEVSAGHRYFVNNCIGKRNYRFFVGFLISLILMAICYLICFIMLIVFSFGVDIAPDPEPGWTGSTANIILIAMIAAPTAVFFLIKFCLLLACLLTKAREKTTKDENNKPETKKATKKVTVDWYHWEPSKVKPRKMMTRAQLKKYKASLVEKQDEAVV